MTTQDVTWATGRVYMGWPARWVTRARAYGRDRVPTSGGVVYAANHMNWIDVPILGVLSPRNVSFVAKAEVLGFPGLGRFVGWHGTIAVRRGASDRDAVRLMRETARRGGVVGLFVEGTRLKLGRPGKAQPGAAMVAVQESRPGRPDRDLRHAVLEARQLRPVLCRLRRAGALRRAAEGRPRLQGSDRRDRAAHQRALRLARGHSRAGPSGRPGSTAVSSTAVKLEGTVAIVGFPNVGKSTLVNRLTATRQAVVHETQGTTRDRKELVCEWNGRSFLLIDTGGVDIADPSPITKQIALQARAAIKEADLVLFVVDARIGVTPGDEELAQILREAKKNVLVLANKIDDPSQESLALEFHRLGFGEPFPISALHGSNTGDLLDEILDLLPGESSRTVEEDAIRVAILGRPNVGKSSLYNKLVGSERTIVSEVPGTTRDTIDTVIEHDGRTFQLIDTAGLRRKRKQRQGIEYYSELRALDAAERADVALVLIDAGEGIVEGDITAVEVARKAHCATLIVLSKWDISEITIEDVRPELARRLRQRPDFITISSLTGRGVSRLLGKVEELYDRFVSRVPTAELNKFIAELKEMRQAPSKGTRRLNLLYGAQVTTRPPRFRFTVNDPGLVTRDYAYWVENQLRERFNLEGVPVVVDFRERS